MAVGRTLWHTIRHAVGLEGPHTQTSQKERDTLKRLVAGRKRAVEIGVYEGATTAMLAAAIKSGGGGRLYAVDPFFPGRAGICWSEIVARSEVRRSGASEVVAFVKDLSTKACRELDGDFDFVFIDGDHSLEGVKQDWQDWSQRIAPGGILALHDTRVPDYNLSVRDLGSYQYFESHIRKDSRFNLLEQVDSLSVLQRV
jgi:predicted O-methyltransferase YrrM